MEFHQLQSFVAVAEEGHLTRAAERLYVSQPAVSAHLKALEEELGVLLFARTPKGMQLTPAGQHLLKQARKTLLAAEEIRVQARALAHEVAGTARIGLNTDPGFLRMPALLASLSARHPKLGLELCQGQSGTICRDVARRELDVGFVYGEVTHPELATLALCTQKLVVAGPARWRERLEAADWPDLAELPWIWVPEECPFHALADTEFSKRGLRPTRYLQADDEAVLLSLVATGAGLSLVSEVQALPAERSESVALWPGGHMVLGLHLVYLEARATDPLVQAVVEGVRRAWDLDGAEAPLPCPPLP